MGQIKNIKLHIVTDIKNSNTQHTTMVRSKKNKLPIEREGIKAENPESYYTLADGEIGRGKFSVVKKATCKKTGKTYAAKIIRFDDENIRYAIREYDLMSGNLQKLEENETLKRSLPFLHETYLVRKYLILIMDLCDGRTLLEYFSSKHSITEDDVAVVVRWLRQVLKELHSNNVVHLDIRPTNIRMTSLNDMKLLDFNSARHLANKKAGEVVDVIGDTEFCAPEMLSFDRVQPGSDIWSVAVIMYILLSGISPYFYEDESKVSSQVEKCIYDVDDNLETVSAEAKDFIKKIFKRAPEMGLTAEKALQHPWLSVDYAPTRKNSKIVQQDRIKETDERLLSEEEEEYIEASFVFRTFEEPEYISPESSEGEDEDEGEDKE